MGESYKSPCLFEMLQINGFVESVQLIRSAPFFSLLKLLKGILDIETSRSQEAPANILVAESPGQRKT